MNEKEDKIIEVGIVKTTYPNAEFNVEIQNGHLVRAGICGKMRKSHFKIIPGDRKKITKFFVYSFLRVITIFVKRRLYNINMDMVLPST